MVAIVRPSGVSASGGAGSSASVIVPGSLRCRADALDGHRHRATAAETEFNRRAVAARLRRSGVHVIDAPPDELAPALADAYLAMKAAGRL